MTTTSAATKVACRFCGDEAPESIAPEMLRCRRCTLVFSVHAEDPAIYELETKVHEWGRRAGTDIARRIALFRLGIVAVHVRRGSRILDIGCGTGDFVGTAASQLYEVVGFDPSAGMRRISERNLEETYGLSPARHIRSRMPLGTWDAITLWDVLEHVGDPSAFLVRLGNALEPGGVIAIVTPDVSAWDPVVAPLETWRHCKPREHLTLFSPATLRRVLDRAGFRVVVEGWDESWIRQDDHRRNLLHVVARRKGDA